jgi:hypothetical protein
MTAIFAAALYLRGRSKVDGGAHARIRVHLPRPQRHLQTRTAEESVTFGETGHLEVIP